MDLITYISSMQRRKLLAEACDCNPHYLYQIATNRRRASPELAELIEKNSELIGPERVPKEPLVFREQVSAPDSASATSDPDERRIVPVEGA
ncbi:hypothetical protein [Xanthomonas sp. 3498]|uniref:hypothetical protein n=1 Tax=Xanthomonas sp. 3498 TaxID=2663863 RepID=UPI00160BE946|nr:hypothetical protein [Xanthomonas sp. 3498]MBB5875863.1 hypothetical protein [Xanthomonas sp. 3498]